MRMQDWQEYRSTALASHDLATAILRAKGYPPPPPPRLPPHPYRKPKKKARRIDLTFGPTTKAINAAVADHFDLEPEELLARSQRWNVARPRQIAFYLIRNLTPRSYLEMGRTFGLDHSTVIHGVRQIERRLQYDADLAADVEALKARLTA